MLRLPPYGASRGNGSPLSLHSATFWNGCERRRIPEHADFRAFKRQRLQLFTSLIQRQQELMHLPDDRTLLLSVSPHPLGGLTFVYENETDRLAPDASFNNLTPMPRASLPNLLKRVAAASKGGQLTL